MLFATDSTVIPLLLLAALAVDAVVGDPPWLPHPVAAFGRLAGWLESVLNRGPDLARFALGLVLALVLIAAATAAGWSITRLPAPWGLAAQGVAAALLLAQRSLYDHVAAVATPLATSGLAAGDLAGARRAISHIVGRDPGALDRPGVARAAIETLAENFADGVAAPVFWFLLFGLPGLCAYKAINTLDSMFGYRNLRYAWFGKATARIDDAANWLPARFAGLAVIAAAALTPGANPRAAWSTMVRDARHNPSPNAGWPEAAMAGAIGVALLGPRSYGGVTAHRPWLGEAFTAEATAGHLRHALAVYLRACAVLTATVAAVALASALA